MLKVVYSNDMRQLAALLAEQQQREPLPPLQIETVIVQSNELARWLSLSLANYHGIASHITFPYPSAYIWTLFRQLLPDVPDTSIYDKDVMLWRLYPLLAKCRQQVGFEAIDRYLGDDPDPLKRYELAYRIADSFDQYLMYRPDWIQAWEQPNTDQPHWQARLWQQLTIGAEEAVHRANLLLRLQQLLTQSDRRPKGLPQRIAIFGISALPPVYLTLYQLMAKWCDVTVYFLSPCEDYWGDLLTAKQQAKLDDGEEMLSSGHPLLANLGKQGQEFFEQIQHCDHISDSYFSDREGESVLAQLQSDVMQLLGPDITDNKRTVAVSDTSIQCHVCHTATREVQILHNQLLALFNQNPALSPTDIVVMTPDINRYAEAIEAVFGNMPAEMMIPYSISGVSLSQHNIVFDTFIQLLQLPYSRCDTESILTLLECDVLRRRFALRYEDLDLIRSWCHETGIHWGLSAQDKAQFGVPETADNTWQAGLDRLLLGYAVPLSDHTGQWCDMAGQVGMNDIQGERAKIMAHFCQFIEALQQTRAQLAVKKTTQGWQQELMTLLTQFFDAEQGSQEDVALLTINDWLLTLTEHTERADYQETLPVDIIQKWLSDKMDASLSVERFMGHGITFCGMVPMRSIPFDVVCLIGLNHDSFPRRQQRLGFDLLADDFRPGDRSRREDDRYLFLEALLSARQVFYMSYIGASVVDNSVMPPSVLVSDVEDVLEQYFTTVSGQAVWSQICTRHPLQAFSERYFSHDSPKLINFQLTQCPPEERTSQVDIQAWSLPEPESNRQQLTVTTLCHFYQHPIRYLLNQRLALYFEQEAEAISPSEPFDLAGLTAWHCQQILLQQRQYGQTMESSVQRLLATGVLPQGELGQYHIALTAKAVTQFIEDHAILTRQFLPTLPVALSVDTFHLSGQLAQINEQGLWHYHLGALNGRQLLTAWCQHVIFNCLTPSEIKQESHLLTNDAQIHFAALAEPEAILKNLLADYWQGCQQPLALFSKSSYAYAKAAFSDSRADPYTASHGAWQGGMYLQGESEDPYYQWLYRDTFPYQAMVLATERIYRPLYQHLTITKRK